jgi:DNA-binding IclR family transcriptional regulator
MSMQESPMVKQDRLESRWADVLDITLVPAVVRLPATVPTERRNIAVRASLLRRIHCEFEEMPGMSLTLSQATALFGISRDAGSRILMGLTEQRVLRLRSDGRYVLHTDQT